MNYRHNETRQQKRLPKIKPAKISRTIRIGGRILRTLLSLDRYRYLTSEQILDIHTNYFATTSHQYLLRYLQAMFHRPLRLINRSTTAVEWGKGSSKFVYTLAPKGAALLIEKGYSLRSKVTPQSASKQKHTTTEYKKHELGVNDFRIASERSALQLGWHLVKEITDAEFKDSSIRQLMRVYDRLYSRFIPIVPDNFQVYKRANGKYAFLFVELVREHTDLENFQLHKIRGYYLFRNKWRELSPFEEFKDADTTYLVLTVADSGTVRTYNLKAKAEQEFMPKTPRKETEAEIEERLKKTKRYYFVELERVKTVNIFSDPIWLQPYTSSTADIRFSLFDKP